MPQVRGPHKAICALWGGDLPILETWDSTKATQSSFARHQIPVPHPFGVLCRKDGTALLLIHHLCLKNISPNCGNLLPGITVICATLIISREKKARSSWIGLFAFRAGRSKIYAKNAQFTAFWSQICTLILQDKLFIMLSLSCEIEQNRILRRTESVLLYLPVESACNSVWRTKGEQENFFGGCLRVSNHF